MSDSAALFPRASHSSSLCLSISSVSSLSASISLLAIASRLALASLKILSISKRVCFSCSRRGGRQASALRLPAPKTRVYTPISEIEPLQKGQWECGGWSAAWLR